MPPGRPEAGLGREPRARNEAQNKEALQHYSESVSHGFTVSVGLPSGHLEIYANTTSQTPHKPVNWRERVKLCGRHRIPATHFLGTIASPKGFPLAAATGSALTRSGIQAGITLSAS